MKFEFKMPTAYNLIHSIDDLEKEDNCQAIASNI